VCEVVSIDSRFVVNAAAFVSTPCWFAFCLLGWQQNHEIDGRRIASWLHKKQRRNDYQRKKQMPTNDSNRIESNRQRSVHVTQPKERTVSDGTLT